MATRPATRKYAANPAQLREGTLVELFLHGIDRHNLPQAQWFRTAAGWQSISHAQLLDNVRALTAALEARGMNRGDRIGLLSENRPEWALADYSHICAGALTVPLYGTLPANQIAFILKDAEARVVMLSNADQLAKITEVMDQLPALEFIVIFDAPAQLPARVVSLQSMLEAGRKIGLMKRPSGSAHCRRGRTMQPR